MEFSEVVVVEHRFVVEKKLVVKNAKLTKSQINLKSLSFSAKYPAKKVNPTNAGIKELIISSLVYEDKEFKKVMVLQKRIRASVVSFSVLLFMNYCLYLVLSQTSQIATS